jgi:cytochrome c1
MATEHLPKQRPSNNRGWGHHAHSSKASAWEEAKVTMAAKHPPETTTIDAAKASADGADMLSAAKHLQERGPEQQATTTVTPPTSTTSQSEEQHEARSGTAQRSSEDERMIRKRFFSDAFKKGVTTKEATLDAIVAGLGTR